MNTIELIRKKRDGDILTRDEISFLISSFTKNKIPAYQFSAFLMAVYFKGMSVEETFYLTEAMLNSGKIADLSFINESKIDKHSTGGVGDKTSLIAAPIAAAAGIKVPMISGRGLGHTGGTLDKLESIPGFKTNLTLNQYKSTLKKTGAVLIGQTKDIAPADKLIYSLRDVTATVESIPLITASIMSKKLAEGIDGLVLDIKTGNGAFTKDQKDSEALAFSLIKSANDFDKKIIAFITDMNQPLGNCIGNWLEVQESIQALQGESAKDLMELSIALSGAMIFLGGKAESFQAGKEISYSLVKNGKAFEKLLEIVKNQGGEIKFINEPDKYPKSKVIEQVISNQEGYLGEIDTFELGIAAAELGAGRKRLDDKIDHKAGIIFNFKIGDKINKGELIAQLYSQSPLKIENVKKKFHRLIKYSPEPVKAPELIKKIIT
jgi:pyrimidine-nucleoside phosphorylase